MDCCSWWREILGRKSILLSRYKSSLQLHGDRNILRIRKINSDSADSMQSAGIYLSFLHPHTHIPPPYFSLSIYLLRFASSSRLRGIQGSSLLPSREKRFSFQLVATRLFIALSVPRRSLPRWRKQEEMLSAFHIYKRVNIYPRRIASFSFFFFLLPSYFPPHHFHKVVSHPAQGPFYFFFFSSTLVLDFVVPSIREHWLKRSIGTPLRFDRERRVTISMANWKPNKRCILVS